MLDFAGVQVSAWALADWIETTVVFGGGPISTARLVDHLAEDSGLEEVYRYDRDYAPEYGEDEALGEIAFDRHDDMTAFEALANEAFEQIKDRAGIVGADYPLRVEGDIVRSAVGNWREAPAYAFLLALNARFVHGLDAHIQDGARLFEELVVLALASYWNGTALRFGAPRSGDTGKQFGDAMKNLSRAMNERLQWEREELPNHTGDMTVDAVAWRPLDGRRGHSVLLCQCAIGGEWETKKLDEEVWRHIVAFAVSPLKGLAFPFVAEAIREFDDFRWEMLCARVGVPFDRLRLAQLLQGIEPEEALRVAIVGWTESLAPSLA